jgi:hypothetical protein
MRRALLLIMSTVALILPGPVGHAATIYDSTSANITNPLFPLPPGRTLIYDGTEDTSKLHDVYRITRQAQVIDGVKCRLVLDRLYRDGVLAETTRDYFAQDTTGTVHYFGEETATLNPDGTLISTEGTWLSGVAGAQSGVQMPAHPAVGQSFLMENAPDVAADKAEILSLNVKVTVPAGTFDAVKVGETTVLEPGVVDRKWYVKGIGTVREQTIKGGTELLKLTKIIEPV